MGACATVLVQFAGLHQATRCPYLYLVCVAGWLIDCHTWGRCSWSFKTTLLESVPLSLLFSLLLFIVSSIL